jgi:hypothetical protein
MKNQLTLLRTSFAVMALCAWSMSHAATPSKTEYNADKDRISAAYKADKAACAALAGNTKDICVEEAKGKEKIALAEAEYVYSHKASDQNKIKVAKAEAAYAVAKEKCDDKSGNAKDVCVQEAKTIETKALADAKMGKEILQSGMDAADGKRDADYKLAIEKCDALSGDAKSSCVATAKSKFGKN